MNRWMDGGMEGWEWIGWMDGWMVWMVWVDGWYGMCGIVRMDGMYGSYGWMNKNERERGGGTLKNKKKIHLSSSCNDK